MYSTCIFCHQSLGQNEALEHFPVGRRVAYDPAAGRLWVVCRACERWNLSPLEIRWEAIEDAEREFRRTPLRVSTDNIGLARLREGLELVRVGAPPRIELAGWRYGDQFGRRRRRHLALGSIWVVAAIVPFAQLALQVSGAMGYAAGYATGAMVFNLGFQGLVHARNWRGERLLVGGVRTAGAGELLLTKWDMRGAALVATAGRLDWTLRLPTATPIQGGVRPRRLTKAQAREAPEHRLAGDDAKRALAMILPHLNGDGGSERRVRDAVDEIAEAPSMHRLFMKAAVPYRKIELKESNLTRLPGRLRLALEMVLHADDERRALDGELRELEARWREADEIARIADRMFESPELNERVAALRERDAARRS